MAVMQQVNAPPQRGSLVCRLLAWLPLAAAILGGGGMPLLALDPSRAVTQYHIDTWRREQGLPQSSITALAQTPDGYLWLATRTGLVRFDGHTFAHFHRRNTPALPHNIVTALQVDGDGALWITTIAPGVTRHHNGTFRAFGEKDGLPRREIGALHCDRHGRLLLAPYRGGLLRREGDRFVPVDLPTPFPAGTVLAYAEAGDGTRWFGTAQGGLARLAGGRLSVWTARNGLPDDWVGALHWDGQDTLWAGTAKGLVSVQNDVVRPGPLPPEARGDVVDRLALDGEGNLWAATRAHGLARLRRNQAALLGEPELAGMAVRALLCDAEGSLWVGTQDGLNRLRDTAVLSFGSREGWPADVVGSFLLSERDEVLLADGAGGLRAATLEGSRVLYASPDGRELNPLLRGTDGSVWLTNARAELLRLRPDGQQDKLPVPLADASDVVWAMAETADGSIWLGTRRSGLHRWKDGRFTTIREGAGLPDRGVTVLLAARDGGLWVGTRNGLLRWAETGLQTWSAREGLASPLVSALFEDKDGVLWVGTSGGLCRQAGGRFVSLRSEHGLPDEGITALQQDAAGDLWAGSNVGIFRLRRTELEGWAARRRRSVTPALYGPADGLRSTEGVPFVAARKARDGRLWFRMRQGMATLHPQHLPFNRHVPTVRVSDMGVRGQFASPGSEQTLAPGTARVELRFTTLSLWRPERNRFRYRLAGYDQDWVEAGHERSAVYTRLPPGRYRFEVLGANNDGVWSAAPATLDLTQQPFFHETTWFAALCALAAIGLLGVAYRLRMRRLEARHALVLAERTRIARELHDTLLQGFSGLALHLEAVSVRIPREPEASQDQLRRVLERMEAYLAEARGAVWEMRKDVKSQGGLTERLATLGTALAQDCPCTFRLKTTGLPRALGPAVEDQLVRVFQEAVANAVRHAGCTAIVATVAYERWNVRLRVEDDGCGFDAQPAASRAGHFGLAGMKERTETVGGRLEVRSRPNAGTCVEALVPFR